MRKWLVGCFVSLAIPITVFAAVEGVTLDTKTKQVINPLVKFGSGNTLNVTGATLLGFPFVTSWNTRTGDVVPLSGDYTAAQVTNAVDSTSSYSDPSWITSLIWSKITSTPTTLSGYGITDGVNTSDSRLTDDRTANAIRTATAKQISTSADPTDGQALVYDGTAGKWKPVTVSGGGGIGGSIADQQVAFGSGTSITGNDNFYWDNASSSLGIGGISGVGHVTWKESDASFYVTGGTSPILIEGASVSIGDDSVNHFASVGSIRLQKNFTVNARNNANSGDVPILSMDLLGAVNAISFGDPAFTNGGIAINLGDSIEISVGSADLFFSSSGTIQIASLTNNGFLKTGSSNGTLSVDTASYQPLDADLTSIAALSTTSFGRGFLTQADATASRSYIGAGTGSGDALVANPLSQFASTTSSQFKGVISDENAPDGASSKVIMALGSLSIASGKTGTFSNTLTFTGNDGSTLNIGSGGTLGTAAYTDASAYEVPLTFSTGLTRSTNTITVNNPLNQNTTGSAGSAATLTTPRSLWGQSFDGSANVTGSLTSVGDITGGASNMAITAGTGNSRTLTLKSTTSGGTATAFLTGNADQSSTFGGNISGTGAWILTGGAGNMTITAGTGNSRTMALQSTTSGGTATTFLTGNADQTVTFASGFTAAGNSSIGASNQFTTGTVLIGSPSGTLGYTDGTGHLTIGATNVANFADPLSVFTRSTSNTIGVGNIELGNATDTTLSRLGAGSLGVEGTAVILNGGALGTPSSGTLTNCTFPTLNQDTTGSAVYWKTSGTGKASITGPATGTTRAYTFPDADSTMLYSGGALGTPSSATLTNATGLPVAGITSSTSTALGVGSIELGNASDTTLSRSSAGVLAVEGVKVLATNSTSGTQQGLIAVNSSSGAVVGTQARAFGTSASGTAGTSVASITAGGGNQFVCINGFANQANSASTQLTLTVTYSDSTTTSFTTTAATAGLVVVNDAAITASSNIGQTGNSTKKITGISVVTAGVGTGSRQASLAAVEIPQ